VLRVHDTVDTRHDQPVPDSAVAVNPAGSVSLTVTVPTVGPVPTFDTVNVYVAPVCP
jgi:hypothetical protein